MAYFSTVATGLPLDRRQHPAQLSLDMEGRRIFDTALGILIGLRRCSSDVAFHELFGAAQSHGFPAFPMAWALVHLAGGGAESAQTLSGAQSAARREWGQFFAPSVASTG